MERQIDNDKEADFMLENDHSVSLKMAKSISVLAITPQ